MSLRSSCIRSSSDVANVEQRTRAAEEALAAAQADYARANGTLTGKDRALKELDTFYSSVLAQDLTGARRLTFARLAQLAAKSQLDFERRKYEPVVERGSNLTRLKVTMDLAGSYADIRDFIHEIESSPEFVVIDDVGLMEERARRRLGAPDIAAFDLLPDDGDDEAMTMRSRLLLLLVVAAIVGGAFYFLRFPAALVNGGTTVPAGGGAQSSRQGNPVGDVRLESLDRQDERLSVDAQPRRIPIRREACGYCRTTATNASSAGRACATSADRTASASSDSASLHRVSRSARGSSTSRGAE